MAVQAEFGESASESGIRQVEVEPTAPISDVSLLNVILSCFYSWNTPVKGREASFWLVHVLVSDAKVMILQENPK